MSTVPYLWGDEESHERYMQKYIINHLRNAQNPSTDAKNEYPLEKEGISKSQIICNIDGSEIFYNMKNTVDINHPGEIIIKDIRATDVEKFINIKIIDNIPYILMKVKGTSNNFIDAYIPAKKIKKPKSKDLKNKGEIAELIYGVGLSILFSNAQDGKLKYSSQVKDVTTNDIINRIENDITPKWKKEIKNKSLKTFENNTNGKNYNRKDFGGAIDEINLYIKMKRSSAVDTASIDEPNTRVAFIEIANDVIKILNNPQNKYKGLALICWNNGIIDKIKISVVGADDDANDKTDCLLSIEKKKMSGGNTKFEIPISLKYGSNQMGQKGLSDFVSKDACKSLCEFAEEYLGFDTNDVKRIEDRYSSIIDLKDVNVDALQEDLLDIFVDVLQGKSNRVNIDKVKNGFLKAFQHKDKRIILQDVAYSNRTLNYKNVVNLFEMIKNDNNSTCAFGWKDQGNQIVYNKSAILTQQTSSLKLYYQPKGSRPFALFQLRFKKETKKSGGFYYRIYFENTTDLFKLINGG